MDITQAISIGYAKVGKQVRGNYFEFCDGKICGACALGCAFLAVASEADMDRVETEAKQPYVYVDDIVYEILLDNGWWGGNSQIQYWNDELELSIPEIIERLGSDE